MYIKNTTMLLIAALCFISCVYAEDKCYVPLNNGALGTAFYVQGETFPPPYACSRTSTAVGFAAPSTYTFSAAETSCGEMVSIPEVSFGRYECELIPAGVPGTVTTCMVASSTRTNFEGVYVKFFGNETSRVFTGYFAGGRSYPTGSLVVDFKTTDKAHKYGFEYTSGYIKWYIDNREVTSAYGGKPLPTTANRFYASLTTEKTGVYTDDTVIPTDSSIDRVFTGLESAVATFTNMSYAPVLFVACDKDTGYLPGDSGWKPYDPSQCDTRERVVVFDDALAKDWTNTDSTDSSFGDTSVPVRTGSKSISWFLTPMTARLYFLFPSTFLSSNYDNFQFWINGNGVFGQQIGIKMIFDDGSTSPEVKINDALDEGVQPYDWSRAVFSFSMFGLTTNARNVKGFVLSSMSIVYGGKIAIDDVSLGYTLPICAHTVENIYADGPASDFSTDMSWGKMEIKSNKVVHGGNYAVQWNLYENGGLRFNTKKKIVSVDKYPGIAFWLNPAELRGQDWTVSVTSPDSTGENNVAGIPLNLFKYYGGPLPQQGTWVRVAVPFYDFGVTDKKARIDGVLFKTSNTYQGTLYIDDIDFISPEQPSSSAALLGAGLFGIVASLAVLFL